MKCLNRYNKNRIWWEMVSVPVRVRRCKRRGLEGRTGSKAYEDLNLEQREQIFGDVIKSEMTLEDHARAWWAEQGVEMPDVCFREGKKMYVKWAKWAFSDLNKKERVL